jgi:hypothetical protein
MSLTGLLPTTKKYEYKSRVEADRGASRRRVGKKEKHSLQMNHSARSPSSESRDQTCLFLSTRLFPLSHSKLSALLPQLEAPNPASQCAIKASTDAVSYTCFSFGSYETLTSGGSTPHRYVGNSKGSRFIRNV